MIDVKEAVKIAHDYFNTLFPRKPLVGLEEAELTEDERHWLITLSSTEVAPLPWLPGTKQYKRFKIDAQTGKVLSMQIRNVQ